MGRSEEEMVLQPMPWRLGYSQLNRQKYMYQSYEAKGWKGETHSKSIPSRLYFCTIFETAATNAVRLLAEANPEENHRDPVQPPIERLALTPYLVISTELFSK